MAKFLQIKLSRLSQNPWKLEPWKIFWLYIYCSITYTEDVTSNGIYTGNITSTQNREYSQLLFHTLWMCMHLPIQTIHRWFMYVHMHILYIPLILVNILGLCLYLYTNMKYTGIAGSIRPTAMAASTGSPITGTNTRNTATNTITIGRGRGTCTYNVIYCSTTLMQYVYVYLCNCNTSILCNIQ